MTSFSRRRFLQSAGLGLGGLAATKLSAWEDQPAQDDNPVVFFLIGDTHYLASRNRPEVLETTSRTLTTRLVDWLNRLPGSNIPESAGGGMVRTPRGVIHAGDVIDSGDKNGRIYQAMQRAEWRGFEADFGLTGRDGRLRWPIYEIHGNHDSPSGEGLVIDGICRRNRQRPGVRQVSGNGLHYSWDWGPVHFVNLGIVVGSAANVNRRRRYAPRDSLQFLVEDLNRNDRNRNRPIVLTHHVDVARYSAACNPRGEVRNPEWDPCDVQGFYEVIRGRRVLGILYGHTHAHNLFRWDGTRNQRARTGIPIFNTDNSSHFQSDTQAFFYFEIHPREMIVREFATRNRWETGAWTPSVWRYPRA